MIKFKCGKLKECFAVLPILNFEWIIYKQEVKIYTIKFAWFWWFVDFIKGKVYENND